MSARTMHAASVLVTFTSLLFTAAPLGAQAQYVYIGSQYSNGGVSAYAMTEFTGALSPVAGSPFAAGQYVMSVAVHPSKAFLYTASQGTNAGIYAFTVDAATGSLAPIAGSPFAAGSAPGAMTIHPSGRFGYAISETGSLFTYQIDQATGVLTAVGSPILPGGALTALFVEPRGLFLYTTRMPGGIVTGYSIDQNTGALTAIAGGSVTSGTTPTSFAADPEGKYLYVTAVGTSKGVFAYRIDTALNAGKLVPLNGGLPYAAGTLPFRGVVEPSGKFLYVANAEFSGVVSAYRISDLNGELTTLPSTAVGNNPQGLAIDPEGEFLYVSTFNGGTVSFSLNATTGGLTPIAGSPFAAPYAARPITAARIDTRTFSFANFAANPPTFFIEKVREGAIDLVIANFKAGAYRANINRSVRYNDCWFRGSFPNTNLGVPPANNFPILQGYSEFALSQVNPAWGACLSLSGATRDMSWFQRLGPSNFRTVSLAERCRNLPGCDPETLQVNTGQFLNYLRHPGWPGRENLRRASIGVQRWGDYDVLPIGVFFLSSPLAAMTWEGPNYLTYLMRLPIGATPPAGVVIGNPQYGAWPEGTLFLENNGWNTSIANYGVVTDGGGPFLKPRTTPVTEVDFQLIRDDAIQQVPGTTIYPPPGATPPGGVFVLKSTFKNTLKGNMKDACFRVTELSGGATQLEGPNLITPPGGRGAASCWGPLAAGASKQIEFRIRTSSSGGRFTFYTESFEGSPGPTLRFDAEKITLPIGSQHGIAVTVLDLDGAPLTIPVEVSLTSPVHPSRLFSGVTQGGVFTSVYSQTTVGTDTLRATIIDSDGTARYVRQTVTWKAP